jgi:hypothetical protein
MPSEREKLVNLLTVMAALVEQAQPVGKLGTDEVDGYLVPTETFVQAMNGINDFSSGQCTCPVCERKRGEELTDGN